MKTVGDVEIIQLPRVLDEKGAIVSVVLASKVF